MKYIWPKAQVAAIIPGTRIFIRNAQCQLVSFQLSTICQFHLIIFKYIIKYIMKFLQYLVSMAQIN